MTIHIDMRVAELLCSRLCHDLLSPVSAVNNGLELMEESDPSIVSEATRLMTGSARQAADKLSFFRVAFGLSGGGEGALSLAQARKLAEGYLAGGNVRLDWPADPDLPWSDGEVALPKDAIKLLLNMILLCIDCLPRGGVIAIRMAALPEGLGLAVMGEGERATIREETKSAIDPAASAETLTARTVQPYFLVSLTRDLGVAFEIDTVAENCVELAAILPD